MSDEWAHRHEIELITLANRDSLEALQMPEKLSETGVRVSAEVALHVAQRCLETPSPPQQKRPRGRPHRSFEDSIARLWDGKAAIEGRPLSKSRSPRDIDRCKAEFRKFIANIPPENAENF